MKGRQMDIFDCIADVEESEVERKAREFKEKLRAWRETGVPLVLPSNFRAVS